MFLWIVINLEIVIWSVTKENSGVSFSLNSQGAGIGEGEESYAVPVGEGGGGDESGDCVDVRRSAYGNAGGRPGGGGGLGMKSVGGGYMSDRWRDDECVEGKERDEDEENDWYRGRADVCEERCFGGDVRSEAKGDDDGAPDVDDDVDVDTSKFE